MIRSGLRTIVFAGSIAAAVMACGSVDGDPDAGGGGGNGDAGGGGNIDAGGGGNPDATPCTDTDNDTVCDADDVCPGSNDLADADSDTVPDGCDICAGFDDTMDTDNDSIPNGCDICMPGDDTVDADNDNVPDACDVCAGFDDAVDADNDNVPDGCDVCAGFDDMVDADSDNVPDGCDICAGFDDNVDTDNDTVPNGCDICAGFDDAVDTDSDNVPDGCDACAGYDDSVDPDNDNYPTGCDLCPGFDDAVDVSPANGIPDGCDCTGFQTTWCYQQGTMEQFTRCESVTNGGLTCNNPEIKYGFLEGGIPRQNGGNNYDTWCQQLGFVQYGNQISYGTRDVAAPRGVVFGCTSYDENTWHWCDWSEGFWYNQSLDYHPTASTDITSITCSDTMCDPLTEVEYQGDCYYLDGSRAQCDAGYALAPQSVLSSIASDFVGKYPKNNADGNCCIVHALQSLEGQDWGAGSGDCGSAGPYQTGPVLGAVGCTDQQNDYANQLTFCGPAPHTNGMGGNYNGAGGSEMENARIACETVHGIGNCCTDGCGTCNNKGYHLCGAPNCNGSTYWNFNDNTQDMTCNWVDPNEILISIDGVNWIQ